MFQFQTVVNPDEELDNVLLQEEVKNCLVKLTPRQQEAVRFFFFDGLSYSEVAKEMGFNPSRARSIIANAIGRLKRPWISRSLKPFWEDT